MNETPLVSVLMTAYNREKYIAEAIESVIASTYQNWELILVDDCSKDRTVEIAKSYEQKDNRIKVFVNKKNLGDYPNRNMAAGYAKGKYLKYIDSDNMIYPHGLEIMVKFIEQYPDAGFALSAPGINESPFPIRLLPDEAYFEHFFKKHILGNSPESAIIKREAFEKIGGFSGIRQIGDFELWLKLAAQFPLVKMVRDLSWDRTHGEQEKAYDQDDYKIIEKHKLTKKLLDDSNCPFDDTQKKQALSNEVRLIKKTVLRFMLREKKRKMARNIMKGLNISWFSLLKL
jgi:glycosyltransferase involved in cell wall biosynthesis